MSWSRLGTCGRLTLRARAAASRVAARGATVRRAPDAWRPIALRWRRHRHARRWNSTLRREVAASLRATLVQMHLHVTTQVLERRERRPRREGDALVVPRPAPRIVAAHGSFAARPPVVARHARFRDRAWLTIRGAEATRSERRGSPASGARPAWPSIRSRDVVRVAARAPFSLAEPGRRHSRTATSTTERAHRVDVTVRRLSRDLRLFRVTRTATPALPSHHSSRQTSSPVVWRDRLPELVWRRPQRLPAGMADEDAPRQVAGASSRGSVRSVTGEDASPGDASRVGRAAAAQVTTLNPALLDRLTDDVIRRVERRVRIERERRGL